MNRLVQYSQTTHKCHKKAKYVDEKKCKKKQKPLTNGEKDVILMRHKEIAIDLYEICRNGGIGRRPGLKIP